MVSISGICKSSSIPTSCPLEVGRNFGSNVFLCNINKKKLWGFFLSLPDCGYFDGDLLLPPEKHLCSLRSVRIEYFFFYFFSSKIIRNTTLFSIVFYSWSLSLTVLTLKTHFAFFSNANFITFILISALLFIWKCLRIYISVQQDWYIQHLTQRYKQDSSKLSHRLICF